MRQIRFTQPTTLQQQRADRGLLSKTGKTVKRALSKLLSPRELVPLSNNATPDEYAAHLAGLVPMETLETWSTFKGGGIKGLMRDAATNAMKRTDSLKTRGIKPDALLLEQRGYPRVDPSRLLREDRDSDTSDGFRQRLVDTALGRRSESASVPKSLFPKPAPKSDDTYSGRLVSYLKEKKDRQEYKPPSLTELIGRSDSETEVDLGAHYKLGLGLAMRQGVQEAAERTTVQKTEPVDTGGPSDGFKDRLVDSALRKLRAATSKGEEAEEDSFTAKLIQSARAKLRD